MQYQMVTTAEQDLILDLIGNNFKEVLVMKLVLKNVNYTIELKNQTSDEFLNLMDSLENAVKTIR